MKHDFGIRSIRTRITALTIAAIMISMLSFGAIGSYFVIAESERMSARNLYLICENRKDSLNEYLYSIQQAVSMISRYATDSMDGTALMEGGVLGADGSSVIQMPGRTEEQRKQMDEYFDKHLESIELAFKSVANHTNGVSTCYFRINPEITTTAKGFYFSKVGSYEFQKLNLTELESYAPDDLEHVGWYYIPREEKKASWIGPYYTANPGEWVMSYAVPMYKAGTFVGVIGMDIQLDTLVRQIRQFTDFKTGYFVLTDNEGRIFYHPEFELDKEAINAYPEVISKIEDLNKESSMQELIRYDKNGKKWRLAFTTLSNNLKLAAVVEEAEINEGTYNLMRVFLAVGVLILLIFIVFITVVMRRVTDPLKNLTTAARRLAAGDYDTELSGESNDEIGVLTNTFSTMRDRIQTQFAELNESKVVLQDALSASQQANRAKTVFLSNMSHEIRTPLNAIIGFANLAKQHIDDRDRVLDYILKISTAGKHLLSLINDVLDVSRIESGRLELKDEVFNFSELIVQINTIIGGQCANKGLNYSHTVIGGVKGFYSGDEMKLKEVLINILGNAVKYTPSGGDISFSVEQVASYRELCTLRFVVRDTGIGMSEEYLPKLFDAFSQEDDGKANQYGSTGLGMTITKNIVEMMNGEILVESSKDVGTTFTITVTLREAGEDAKEEPFVPVDEASQEASDKVLDEKEESKSLKGLHVLIVEDMVINAELLKHILELKEIEYTCAENGQIALERFSESDPGYYDAVLMDIRMPVMDGLEATRRIRSLDREDAKTIPIIAMSANAFAEDVQLSLQAGMTAHLSKPVDTEQLFEALGKFTR